MTEYVTEYIKAWECIGCGRIESQETCLGVCQDRAQKFVYASDYEELLGRLDAAQRQAQALEGVVRAMAWTAPRNGEWERSYRALQAEARRILGRR